MIVLKIIGFVLLGIIALIIIALSIKVRIFIEYSEVDTNVKIKYLFLNIPIYPSKKSDSSEAAPVTEKADSSVNAVENPADSTSEETVADSGVQQSEPETQAETENPSTDAEQAPKQKNNLLKTLYNAHGIDGLMLLVNRVFSYLGTFFGDLMHSLVIEELYIDVMCTKNDAASTAIYYGEVCSGLFPMLGALVTKYKVRKYDINVYPDFLAKTSSASFAVSMHLYPIYVIGISLSLVFKMVFKVLLRLIVKCFLPLKKNVAENSNKADCNTVAIK